MCNIKSKNPNEIEIGIGNRRGGEKNLYHRSTKIETVKFLVTRLIPGSASLTCDNIVKKKNKYMNKNVFSH